jgi:hypothetical protein
MRLAALIASFVLILTARAAAQPGTVAPAPDAPPGASSPAAPAPPAPLSAAAPTPAPPPANGERDEGTALLLSLGGTAASWTVLFVAGSIDHGNNAVVPLAGISALLAPSFGHWYAGTPITGWLGLRAAALVPVVYALGACSDDCNPHGLVWAGYLALALYTAGTVGDIATAAGDVRRHNEQRRVLRDLTVTPMLVRNAGGVMLGARF